MARRAMWTVILACALGAAGAAAPRSTTLTVGGAQRRAILNAVRTPVEKELKQKVRFRVDHLRSDGEWAFFFGAPQSAGGRAPDYRKTRYREAVAAGAFDNGVSALLRKRGGRWRLLTYVLGATDVPWEGWPKRYGAPRRLFP